MKIFQSIYEFQSNAKTVLTLGTFDGVHLGHQAILKRLKNAGAVLQCETVVLTFFPHPRMVLQQDSGIKLLNTIDEKAFLLEKAQVANLVVHPFDVKFSKLSAEDFVTEILVKQFNIAKIIIGYDHRFGKNRSATIEDLIAFGEQFGFEVEQISAEEINEVSVSSTKIRTALDSGNISLANKYLGYDYFFTGTVVTGKQNGRTIGFPTANIKVEETYKLIPQDGVYVVSAEIDQQRVYGMMNIGNNPTLDGKSKSIEVHFFNFQDNLYGRSLTIMLHERLRSEVKFSSVDMLKEQLIKDREQSLDYISKVK
ncbi:bifunctional riboflavin kinase/FAD synthetase [Flavobacterium enshiense]|uniref:bifunctional riboflavin kinase/FAD synthetase n=1 Tax=Flavobacterium enshiense TaxID=1341165 RepID=UPI00345CCBD3